MEVEIDKEKEKQNTVLDKKSNDYEAKENPVEWTLPKKEVTAREKEKIENNAYENRHKFFRLGISKE